LAGGGHGDLTQLLQLARLGRYRAGLTAHAHVGSIQFRVYGCFDARHAAVEHAPLTGRQSRLSQSFSLLTLPQAPGQRPCLEHRPPCSRTGTSIFHGSPRVCLPVR
jgi:hypothetical protein